MPVKIGNASISENGTIRGSAGDQNGKEVCFGTWKKHSKGWVTLRCKDENMREHIAEAMEKACKNSNIGYDQIENQTLWNDVKNEGFDPSKTSKKVETDCARLIRVCVQYACEKVGNGKTIPDFYTATLANVLVKTGLFEKLTDSKYNTQDKYLLRGDIQVTRTKGHTWVILENGSSSADNKNLIEYGDKGDKVKEIQELLIAAGYPLQKYGADGDFGNETLTAVKAFQTAFKLEVDGIVGDKTLNALKGAQSVKRVVVTGSRVNVRAGNNTSFKILFVAKKGDTFEHVATASNGWFKIRNNGILCYISNKYSKLA